MLWDWGPFMKGGGKRKHKISPCAALMIRRRVWDNPGTNDLKAAGVTETTTVRRQLVAHYSLKSYIACKVLL